MFGPFGWAFEFLQIKRITSDNYVFQLFYKHTIAIHVAFVVILGWSQYFGNPIICNSSGLIQSYCWIQGMWTIKEKDNLYNHGTGVQAHPGVGVFNPDRHEKVFHRFYQWVPFVLLISAFVFYLPRYLWTIADDGRMAHICKDMQDQAVENDEQEERVKRLMALYNDPGRNRNRRYTLMLVGCELLNCVSVFVVWNMTDVFLGGRFNAYGRYLLTYLRHGMITDGPLEEPAWDVNPMDSLFPKMAKCDFHQIGASGTEEKVDTMCVLPLNVVNEKIYYFLWLWYILLAVAALINIAYRIITFYSVQLRKTCMHSRHAGVDAFNIGIVLKHWGDYGDWYVLSKIQRNTDYETFGKFVKRLVEKVKVEEEKEDEARGKKAKKDLMNDDDTTEPDEQIKVPPAEADTPSNSKHAKVLKTRAEHLVLKTQKKAAKAGQLVMSAVNSAVNSAANTPLGSPMNSPRTRRRNNNNRLAVPPAVAATVAAAAAEMSPIKSDRTRPSEKKKDDPPKKSETTVVVVMEEGTGDGAASAENTVHG